LPFFIHPEPGDFKAVPELFQAGNRLRNVFLVGAFIDRVASAVVVPDYKEAGGFIQIDRNLDAAHDLGNVFLLGNDAVHAGFRDHVHEVDRIFLLDPGQYGELYSSIHAVQAGSSRIHGRDYSTDPLFSEDESAQQVARQPAEDGAENYIEGILHLFRASKYS
jgi:hypothetical protein